MIEAGELDDPASARIARFLPQFRFVPAPDPDAGDWSRLGGAPGRPQLQERRPARRHVHRDRRRLRHREQHAGGAAPSRHRRGRSILHAEGRPGEAAFVDVPV